MQKKKKNKKLENRPGFGSNCFLFQLGMDALFRVVDVTKRGINALYAFVVPELWDKNTQYDTSNILVDGRYGLQHPDSQWTQEARERLRRVKKSYS